MELFLKIAAIIICSPFAYTFLKHWLSEAPNDDSINNWYYKPEKHDENS